MNLTDAEILELEHLLELEQIDKSKDSLLEFTKYTFDKFIVTPFHKMYYDVLQLFADDYIILFDNQLYATLQWWQRQRWWPPSEGVQHSANH